MSYWVAIVARNASKHLPSTLDSLIHQSLKPKQLVIVNDGSNDGTRKLLLDYVKRYPNLLRVLTLPDNGYDIRRVPRNINLAYRSAAALGLNTEYFMISGDDCTYPSNYVAEHIARMTSESRIAVASGRSSTEGNLSEEHSPSGSGRMIRCSFWNDIGGRYPIKAGWETWLLYKALEKGFQVKLFRDLTCHHARPRGAKHQFEYWGAAMHSLGYHPLYAVGRVAKNMVGRYLAIKGSLNMLRGYLRACLGSADLFISSFEPSLRKFVLTEQSRRIAKVVTGLL